MANAEERIKLEKALLNAQEVLKKEYLSRALSTIAGDHYENLFSKQNLILNWVDKFEKETELIMIAFFLEQKGLKLLESDFEKESKEILAYSAQVFEYVTKFLFKKTRTNMQTFIKLLKHAAICYDCAGFPSNSVVMANLALKEFECNQVSEDTTPIESFAFECDRILLFFLSRNFASLNNLITESLPKSEYIINKIEESEPTEKQALLIDFLCSRQLIHSISLFSKYLQTGHEELFNEALSAIESNIKILLIADEAQNFTLNALFRYALKQVYQRSLWVVLPKRITEVSTYMNLLTRSNECITELWESQLQALKEGLLDEKKRVVISMPTSAGKTMIAELAIVNSLIENPESTCIYVSPSRALAMQIEKDLQKRIHKIGHKVSLLAGSYDCPEIEKIKLRDCKVLVTTPEKLNLLMKDKKEEVIQNCSLFIFDEAQTIQMGGRGIHLEILLLRLKHLFPDSRFLLLSAVMKNAEDIGQWINPSSKSTIALDWHPTRLLQGIYYNGIVSYYEPLKWLKVEFNAPKENSIREKALTLVNAYKKIGSILIFCSSKRAAEKMAALIYTRKIWFENPVESAKRLQALSNRIRVQFGDDFPLSRYIEHGLAYHHADLPSEIRSEIETLVKAGDIKIVCSTTTLAEGINTPVSTVIIPYLNFQEYKADSATRQRHVQWTPLTKSLYRNIAGRAGRALQNTEGHVIIIKPNNQEINKVKSYINQNRSDLEPIRSSLFDLETENERLNLADKNVLAFQTEILAAMCDGLYRGDNPRNLLDLTFFNFKLEGNSISYQNLLQHIKLQLNQMESNGVVVHHSPYKPTDFGSVCNETGLSPESCKRLLEEIEPLYRYNKNFFNIPVKKEIEQNNYLLYNLRKILSLAFIPREVQDSETFNFINNHSQVLLDWVFEKSHFDLANEYFKQTTKEESMLRTFAYIHIQLMYHVPWVLWTMNKLLDYKGIKTSNGVKMLPAFAKYGTYDTAAVYCSALGVHNRSAAKNLAHAYRKINPVIEFRPLLEWLFSLSFDSVNHIIKNEKMAKCTFDDIRKGKDYIERIM